MRLVLAFITLVTILAGCASDLRMPERVEIPIAVGCLRELPPKPTLRTAAELAALDDYQLPIALQADRLARIQYQRLLEAAIEACKAKEGK